MQVIYKKININKYLSKAGSNSTIDIYKNNGWITPSSGNSGWGYPFSDISINSILSLVTSGSPLNNIPYLSYRDIIRIKRILDDFQTFIGTYIINGCEYQNLNQELYNTKYEKYILYGGKNVLLFVYSVLGINLNNYYGLADNKWILIENKTNDFTKYKNYELNKAGINILLSINQDIKSLGINEPDVKEWVKGKTYYIGDIVLFNNNTYILASGTTYYGDFNEDFSDDFYNGNLEISDNFSGIYSEIEDDYFFDNYISDSGTGFFSSYIMNGNDYTHWVRNIRDDSLLIPSNDLILANKNIKSTKICRSESQLTTLKSYKPSSGNSNFFDQEGYYKVGLKMNLKSIKDTNNIIRNYWSYITDINYVISGSSEIMVYDYIIDAEYDNNGNDIADTGVKYKDTYYKYSLDNSNFILSTSEIINYDDLDNYKTNVYMGNGQYEVLTPVSGNTTLIPLEKFSDELTFNLSKNYKKEYLLSIDAVPNVDNNLNIDRGNATAFEYHNKLSEVKTIDDLITYGNGFFSIKT